jgi:hypothetical protein
MLADFLLERGRTKEALAEYELCLKTSPGRLNSLYGAGLAAERAGEPATARRHYGELAAMVVADAERAEIAHARKFVAAGASPAAGARAARVSPGVR